MGLRFPSSLHAVHSVDSSQGVATVPGRAVGLLTQPVAGLGPPTTNPSISDELGSGPAAVSTLISEQERTHSGAQEPEGQRLLPRSS